MFDFKGLVTLSSDALSSIKDLEFSLLDILDKLNQATPQYNYSAMIAGGFARDLYQSKPFNDIDVYVFSSNKGIPDDTFREILLKTNRFEPIQGKCSDFFYTTIFCKEQDEQAAQPICRVQFINWYSSPKSALSKFDLEHCKFFIPIYNENTSSKFATPSHLKHGHLYAYPSAIKALESQELVFSSFTAQKLDEYTGHRFFEEYALHVFEKIIYRVKKFKKRGMKLNSVNEANLTKLLESYLHTHASAIYAREKIYPDVKSVFLDRALEYIPNISSPSAFHLKEVVDNLIKEWIELLPYDARYALLLSESRLIRSVVEELLRRDNKETAISII